MSETTAIVWTTQRVYPALWLRAIMLLAPLSGLAFLPGEFADPAGIPWPLLAVFLFMVICMWPLAFAAHWINGDSDGITIRYWPLLSRRIEYEHLVSVDYRRRVSPWDFGGIGLRLASGGILALVNRKGPGIGMRLADGRAYFVILRDQRELQLVQERIGQVRPDLEGHQDH